MVMTGNNLKFATPNEVITARDDWSITEQEAMAVARGNAVVETREEAGASPPTTAGARDTS